MSAVAQLPQMKALAAARKKLREKAELEAQLLLEGAQVSANALIENGKRIKQEAQEFKRRIEAEQTTPPPKWTMDYAIPLRFYYNNWMLGVTINFKITHFDVEWPSALGETQQFTWDALPMKEQKILLWIPVGKNGEFAATSVSVDKYFPQLPHISHDRSCMGLACSITKIRGGGDLETVRQALENCHRRVQLNSLFTDQAYLIKQFGESIPIDVKDSLQIAVGRSEIVEQLKKLIKKKALTLQTSSEERERNTTWTV